MARRWQRLVLASSSPVPSRGELAERSRATEARTIRGSYIGSCVPSRGIPAFVALYRRGRLPVEKLVTRTIALEDINEAMDALADASVIRQVIAF